MTERGIRERVKELCEKVVLVEPTDLKGLGDLYSRLEVIGRWAAKVSEPEVAAAAEAAAKLLKDMFLEEAADPVAFLRAISDTCSAFSAIICDGRSAAEMAFPAELGLGENRESPVRDDSRDTASLSETEVSPLVTLPPHVDKKIFVNFLSHQPEVLDKMEELILDLEKSDDPDSLGELRRLIHTLKGEAALLGLGDVEQLCHATEDTLGKNRPCEVVECLLGVKDWLARACAAYFR